MPYSCNIGSCGNCRFELSEGDVRHLRQDPPAWSERDLKRNRWLGCQAQPQGDCTIKFREMDQYVPRDRPKRRRARLVEVTRVTRDISDFAFEVEGDPAFRPGQYALFHAPGVEGGARLLDVEPRPGRPLALHDQGDARGRGDRVALRRRTGGQADARRPLRHRPSAARSWTRHRLSRGRLGAVADGLDRAGGAGGGATERPSPAPLLRRARRARPLRAGRPC